MWIGISVKKTIKNSWPYAGNDKIYRSHENKIKLSTNCQLLEVLSVGVTHFYVYLFLRFYARCRLGKVFFQSAWVCVNVAVLVFVVLVCSWRVRSFIEFSDRLGLWVCQSLLILFVGIFVNIFIFYAVNFYFSIFGEDMFLVAGTLGFWLSSRRGNLLRNYEWDNWVRLRLSCFGFVSDEGDKHF